MTSEIIVDRPSPATDGDAAGARDAKPPGKNYPHYVLAVLCLANVFSVADRNIMGLLLEPIKTDLQASDTEMSLLTGAAFVIFYAIFGIPIARWADRGNRRSILSLGIAVWSMATAACGMAGNFLQMAFARAGVGMGEASGTPTSLSLIADYYPRQKRPQMIAMFNLAIYAGGICLTPLIGILADVYSWRTAFVVLGLPGIAVALLVQLTVREPRRGAMDTEAPRIESQTAWSSIKTIMSSKPFVLILLGTALAGVGAGTFGGWAAALAMRKFHLTASEVASTYAPLSAMAGVAGTLLGGFSTTWLVKHRRSERWLVLAPALVSILTIVAGVLYGFPPSWPVMIAAGMLGSFTLGYRTSPYLALSLSLVPANCRGMASAANVFAASVIGLAGGPLIVGLVSDALSDTYGPVKSLQYGFIIAPTGLALAVIPFLMALKYFDDDGVKKEYAIT
jgi:MFS family permease